MNYKYMGEMTFAEAKEKYGKKLPDLTELKEMPEDVIKQSKNHDAWGIVLDKKGKIVCGLARWFGDIFFYNLVYFQDDRRRGVFIVDAKTKKRTTNKNMRFKTVGRTRVRI